MYDVPSVGVVLCDVPSVGVVLCCVMYLDMNICERVHSYTSCPTCFQPYIIYTYVAYAPTLYCESPSQVVHIST